MLGWPMRIPVPWRRRDGTTVLVVVVLECRGPLPALVRYGVPASTVPGVRLEAICDHGTGAPYDALALSDADLDTLLAAALAVLPPLLAAAHKAQADTIERMRCRDGLASLIAGFRQQYTIRLVP